MRELSLGTPETLLSRAKGILYPSHQFACIREVIAEGILLPEVEQMPSGAIGQLLTFPSPTLAPLNRLLHSTT